jgi:hypothetical protein
MIGAMIGQLGFVTPWILGALIFLPALWWLLKVTPPGPKRVVFPALRLLRDILKREETPARTPIWLLLLRMVLAAAVIVALAGPVLNPFAQLGGRGPVILVLDNGWAAAQDWETRQRQMTEIAAEAEREGRDMYFLATAPPPSGEPMQVSTRMRAIELGRMAGAVTPVSWPSDRAAAAAALEDFHKTLSEEAYVIYLSDSLGSADDARLFRTLQSFGAAALYTDVSSFPQIIQAPRVEGDELVVPVFRPYKAGPGHAVLRALGEEGRLIDRVELAFEPGQDKAEARIRAPAEIRRDIARLALENQPSAGGSWLFDERWRDRPVGLVGGQGDATRQPLLTELYYLTRALSPFTTVKEGGIEEMLEAGVSVIVLADIGTLTVPEIEGLSRFMENGGVVVRFAGPRLARAAGPDDPLTPVRVRAGERAMGGALSWSTPQHLAPMPAAGPLAGLDVPPDVTVSRQVLAEPTLDLEQKVWARLADDTPLVTGEQRGRGWLVLVHTTANAEWSNLALSGLFVDMMRRFTDLSMGLAGGDAAAGLDPLYALDGFGRLGGPPASAAPVPGLRFDETRIARDHPPGYYGREDSRRALNLSDHIPVPAPLRELPRGMAKASYGPSGEISLKPHFLTLAYLLGLIDILIGLKLRGLLRIRRRAAAAAALLLLLLPRPALAYSDSELLDIANGNYLAYVETGDPEQDRISRLGLLGLKRILDDRTAVEVTGAMGVDIERDELAFFPMLYWPVTPSQPDLSDSAVAKLNTYMRRGGTLIFDTRDALYGEAGGPERDRLIEITRRLDLPPVEVAPGDHVMGRAFYLLSDYPGRYDGAPLWVASSEEEGLNDGVSPVIVTSGDLAGAWAVDDNGRGLFACVPGGERQREMAYRVGVNLVMYALTGNYKSDQVHLPFILERLGQ